MNITTATTENRSRSNTALIDVHCHLLPGIDDGAKDLETSIQLLRQEKHDGVQAIMLTPHFYYERVELEVFVQKRKRAYDLMTEAMKEQGIEMDTRLGAEVYFSPALPYLDLSELAFEGTSYVLIELPTTHHPSGVAETLFEIQQQGYTPILAHVERYPYVTENPALLYQWVQAGALAQINSSGLIRGGKIAQLLHRYIKWHLVHLLGSDAHSIKHRPPNLAEAYAALEPAVAQYFKYNGEDVFDGIDLEPLEPKEPRRVFWQWV